MHVIDWTSTSFGIFCWSQRHFNLTNRFQGGTRLWGWFQIASILERSGSSWFLNFKTGRGSIQEAWISIKTNLSRQHVELEMLIAWKCILDSPNLRIHATELNVKSSNLDTQVANMNIQMITSNLTLGPQDKKQRLQRISTWNWSFAILVSKHGNLKCQVITWQLWLMSTWAVKT